MAMPSQITSPIILTIDIGTSSSRAMLFDANGQAVPGMLAQIPNYLQTTGDGGAFFNIAEIEQNVVESIDRLLDTAGPLAHQIGCVTMATLVSNVVGVTKGGEAVSPVYTYADTRNVRASEKFKNRFSERDQSEIHNRTGCLIHTSYLPARFQWLQDTSPELLERADFWMSISEYLYWRFLGIRAVSYSVASWSGLLNRWTLQWDEEWLSKLNIDRQCLSPLTDIHESISGLTERWAKRWPMLKNIPWIPAIGDGAAANVGSGCGTVDDVQGQRRMALTVGTTGAMRIVVRAQKADLMNVPAGLWLYRLDKDRCLLGGATTEGGNLYSWLRKTLTLPDSETIESTLVARQPYQHGLTVLPFVAGERAPGWKGDAKASIIGFTLNTQAIDILQACLEGIAYRFAIIYDRITAVEPQRDHSTRDPTQQVQIIASGGAILSSPAWLQIMADTLNQPVVALIEEEITARGLALIGLQHLGVIQNVSQSPPRFGSTFEPDADRHALHQPAIQKQHELYEQVLD